MSENSQNKRSLQGRVVSSGKMQSTITVKVDRLVRHPLYEKSLRKSRKYLVHDAAGKANAGDMVIIKETCPISARKSWVLSEIVERAK